MAKIDTIGDSEVHKFDDPLALLKVGDYTIYFDYFKAGELEKLTELSVDMQRVWRRRGYLPSRKDEFHSRFSTREVARIALMRRMAYLGTPLEEAKIYAERNERLLCLYLLFTTFNPFVLNLREMAEEFMPLYEEMRLRFMAEEEDGEGSLLVRTDFEDWNTVSYTEFNMEFYELATVISLKKLAENIRISVDRPLFKVELSMTRMPPADLGTWKITVPRTGRLAKRKASGLPR